MGRTINCRGNFLLLIVCALISAHSGAQTFNSLVNFDMSNGANPYYVSLVQGRDGAFYGTTVNGGAENKGTVFRVAADGALTTLYTFCSAPDCTDGSYPAAGLVQGTDGNFYGTASGGGIHGQGRVFKITAAGTLTTIHDFNGADGAAPYAGLVEAANGSFYGTTYLGGTVFRVTSSGLFTNLHYFDGTDGGGPWESLIQATDGNLYGTTIAGGTYGFGAIFKISPLGQFTAFHSFTLDEGHYPYGGLLQGSDGNLYGTTFTGGDHDGGTLFRITLAGSLTTPCSFQKGAGPRGILIEGTDRRLYSRPQEAVMVSELFSEPRNSD